MILRSFLLAARAVSIGAFSIGLIACTAAPAPARAPAPAQSAQASAPTSAPAEGATPVVAEPRVTSEAATSSTPAPVSDVAEQDFAPKQRSVWNTTVSQDVMNGACTQGSVLPAYGLVQITPATGGDGGLEWKNQEPKPYPMKRLGANEYQYSGPNSINDGVVTMTVKFLDEKNLMMLREFTENADPTCTHTHEYTGVFQWFR